MDVRESREPGRERPPPEEERGSEPAPDARVPLPELDGPASVPNLMRMQATAGNQAVGQYLARQPAAPPAQAPAATGPSANIAKLDDELDDLNVDEDAVIDLLGKLNPTEKATVIAGGYRDRIASALNVGEMVRAVTNLGPQLHVKLDWVKAAGSPDYHEIRSLVTGTANQAERDALKTTPWRDWFVGVCTNVTMAEAVYDLAFDLGTKLDWMIEEGTDGELAAWVIRRTPAADLPPVAANQALMDRLSDELGDDFANVEKMIRHGLLSEARVTNTTDTGNAYKTWVSLYRSGVRLSKRVKFVERDTFAAGGFATLKGRMIAAVTSYLSGKYKLKIESPGGAREGDGEYPITVHILDDPSGPFPVELHGGVHGDAYMTEDGGHLYELGSAGETQEQDITMAHESAHMILGASDEYANASVPGRTLHTDHSLMGNYYNEGIAAAEIKARHFGFLVTEVSQYFPGRAISIVK
jgi:hypothetical protein